MTKWKRVGDCRILDFDIECRPLSWYGGLWVSKEITSIACRWIGQRKTEVWLLGEVEPETILREFMLRYDEADMVTGHYIRGFDLPSINGALLEFELPLLGPKLTQDTKLDLVQIDGLSKSQENLSSLYDDIKAPKIGMNQGRWRRANRLTPEGLEATRERVVGDVRQHIEMRAKLLELGALGPPKLWRPRSSYRPGYAA